MTVRPILFSGPMIRALLDGSKTQTRRVIKEQPDFEATDCANARLGGRNDWWDFWSPETPRCHRFRLPYVPGDLLWVRETWKPHSLFENLAPRDIPKSNIFWKADDRYAPSNTRWRPSIHMPRWASRLTLVVTTVRVERSQDISEEDAKAEGATAWTGALQSYRTDFYRIWTEINGAESWEANPWVCAIAFSVHRENVDAFLARTAPAPQENADG